MDEPIKKLLGWFIIISMLIVLGFYIVGFLRIRGFF
jgi:hypothetical protein